MLAVVAVVVLAVSVCGGVGGGGVGGAGSAAQAGPPASVYQLGYLSLCGTTLQLQAKAPKEFGHLLLSTHVINTINRSIVWYTCHATPTGFLEADTNELSVNEQSSNDTNDTVELSMLINDTIEY